jgi:hypothetical protein
MSGSYNVSTEAALDAAIVAIDAASLSDPAGTAYSISFATNITLTSDLAAITLANGDSLSVTGMSAKPAKIVGGGHRGFVVESGNVSLVNFKLAGFRAKGGDGGAGVLAGGGGAGLGGALFVGAGADVTVSSVGFSNNSAAGGQGGKASKNGPPVGAGGAGEPDGFGAGGAGGVAGGFGGGGGSGELGGFGGGANAGGGLAAGSNIFVQAGGTLTFASGVTAAGHLNPGGPHGLSYGNNIFIQGNTTLTIGSVKMDGVIADQGGNGGAGSLAITGTTSLLEANTYSGGTQIDGGVLTLAKTGAAGSGEVTFAPGMPGELVIGSKTAITNTVGDFVTGDLLDVQGVGTATGYSLSTSDVLTLLGTSKPVKIQLDPSTNYANYAFLVNADGIGVGTVISVITTHFDVGSEAQWNAAMTAIDQGGAMAQPNEKYTISLTGSFTLTADMEAINLAAGSSVKISGDGQTIDGGGKYRGVFVYGGSAELDDLTIADAAATGGNGGSGSQGGGGGAGMGGGLFVAAGTAVTLDDVNFANDSAVGGNAGAQNAAAFYFGGGGGMGGAGGDGNTLAGGGGGVGSGATGGTAGVSPNGGAGILVGAASGAFGTGNGGANVPPGGAGGAYGGGGGAAGVIRTGGSGKGGGGGHQYPGIAGPGGDTGNGSFGGGGTSGYQGGYAAGFGGGGASGAGGYGGGGGGGAAGGFGGGAGSANGGAGGGGGLGGDVFVQAGGSLTITGAGTASGGTVAGGAGANGGDGGVGYGSGIFFQGSNAVTFAPAAGQSLTLGDVIADEAGVAGAGGAVSLTMAGPGTLTLTASNLFSGGLALNGGTLSLQAPGAAGTGTITFGYGGDATLVVGAGDVPANTLAFFIPGDVIDLQGVGTETSALLGPNDQLAITGGTTPVSLQFSAAQNFTNETFAVKTDGQGGTLLTAVDANNDLPPAIAGAAVDGNDHTAFSPLADVTVSTLIPGQVETATLDLSTIADGAFSNFGHGSYDAANGIFTDTGTAAQLTADLQNLVFTPTEYQVAPGGVVTTGLNLSVTDGTMTAASPFSFGVTALNDAPVIAGGTSWQDAYWDVPFTPFTGVSVTDPDNGASETATLTVGGDFSYASGTFALASPVDGVTLTQTGSGVYTLSAATPAALTAALNAVTFTPTSGDPALGFTINSLGISVSDGIAPPEAAGFTVSAGLPILAGVPANQNVASKGTLALFSAGVITDSAYFTSESVSITVLPNGSTTGAGTDANGTLTGTGLTKTGVGTYSLAAGSPAAVTAELESVVFHAAKVAAGTTEATGFDVSIFDGATTSDWYNEVVTLGAGAVAPTAKMGFLAPSVSSAAVLGLAAASGAPAGVMSGTVKAWGRTLTAGGPVLELGAMPRHVVAVAMGLHAGGGW